MRIDAHIHGMHAERNENGLLIPPLSIGWDRRDDAIQMIRENYSNGLEKVIVLDPPAVTFELHEIFGDFVIPTPQVDMDKTTPREIAELFDRGARGIKFIAPMHPYGDNRYFPLYAAVAEYRGLAIFHTGYLLNDMFDPGCVLEREDYIDITHMRPAGLDRIARAFPGLRILMAHFGNPWWHEAWCVLRSHRNIYADLSGGTACRVDLAFWKQLFKPNGKLDFGSVERLCYASDGGAFHPGISNYRTLMNFYDRLYEELELPEELIEMINRVNILAALS